MTNLYTVKTLGPGLVAGIAGVLLASATFLAGCGAFKVRDRSPGEVEKIRKVAVVAFTVTHATSGTLNMSLNSGKVSGAAGGGGVGSASEVADEIYSDYIKSLHDNLRWQVMDRKELAAKPGYQAAFEKTMKGWQNKQLVPEGSKEIFAQGIMDAEGTRILGADGRKKLLADLNVDAILMAHVNIDIEATTIMGIGSRYPKARLSFQVFSATQDGPIWFDGGIEGEKSSKSVGSTGFYREDLLLSLGRESAQTAFDRVKM